MVLIAMSLALYLVSLIPHGELLSEPKNTKTLLPETFIIHYTQILQLNPQTGVRMVIETNGTLNMKLFNLHVNEISKSLPFVGNLTLLEAFTASHSNYLTRELNISSGTTTYEYIPPRIENATIILSNPTSAVVHFTYENKTITVIASPERIFLALIITIPLGVALTMPRIVSTLRERRKVKKQS